MSVRRHSASAVSQVNSHHAEGPMWDDMTHELLWVDIYEGLVHRAKWTGARLEVLDTYSVGAAIGAVVPSLDPDGGWVVVAGDGISRLGRDGTCVPLRDIDQERSETTRMNDAKCDPYGNLWAGSMAHDRRVDGGNLYLIDGVTHDIAVLTAATISNGLAWAADARTAYFIDTPSQRVDTFTLGPDGRPTGRDVSFTIDANLGAPDGMCIDAEDCLWIAMWGAGSVLRFSPAGEVLDSVEVAASQTSSCALGGPELTTLFITTSQEGFTEEQSRAEPEAGMIFAATVDVPGVPVARFGRGTAR